MECKIKRTIAILLAVCFLVSLTATAVGAAIQQPTVPYVKNANPTSGKAPLKVEFTDKSTGSPTSWTWNFGDGTYSTLKNPVHKYNAFGFHDALIENN